MLTLLGRIPAPKLAFVAAIRAASAWRRGVLAVTLTSRLFKLARLSATASAVASGNPKRIIRRGRNIVVGRALRHLGFWRALWGR